MPLQSISDHSYHRLSSLFSYDCSILDKPAGGNSFFLLPRLILFTILPNFVTFNDGGLMKVCSRMFINTLRVIQKETHSLGPGWRINMSHPMKQCMKQIRYIRILHKSQHLEWNHKLISALNIKSSSSYALRFLHLCYFAPTQYYDKGQLSSFWCVQNQGYSRPPADEHEKTRFQADDQRHKKQNWYTCRVAEPSKPEMRNQGCEPPKQNETNSEDWECLGATQWVIKMTCSFQPSIFPL